MKFFPGQGKVREFSGWPGKLERSCKVREKSGNLKIHGYGRQSSENLFIFFKRGNDVLSHEIVLSPSLYLLGATLKGKNLLPWGANSFI